MAILTKDTFQFLRDLAANNHKEWMDANRERYQMHRQKVIELSAALYDRLAEVDVMPLVDPKKSVARINRNRRFHPDKPPYKTNFAIMLKRGEGKGDFYVHIEPDNSFVGGGLYHPPRPDLDNVRAYIAQHGDQLKAVESDEDFKDYFGSIEGAKLKTSPRDYSAEHKHIEYLRMKDLVIMHSLDNKEFLKDGITGHIRNAYRAALPFLDFIDRGAY